MKKLAKQLLLLGALITAADARAQSPASGTGNGTTDGSAPRTDERIVVTGTRNPERAIEDYVEAITVESRDQIAKFQTPICPASFGLPAGHNEVIAERVRLIAEYMNIRTGRAGCRPNVVIIIADQGGDFVNLLRRERPDLFAAFELSEIRDVERLSGPVRAWQVIEARGADGRPMERISWLEMGGGPPRYIPHGYRLDGVMPSLTSRPTRQDLTLSFIVFDLNAIEGLTLLQIADHAAMRALARTNTAAVPARRSILSLFADRNSGVDPVGELTSWDVAYLSALYRTGNNVSAQQQRSSMARTMQRDLDLEPAMRRSPNP